MISAVATAAQTCQNRHMGATTRTGRLLPKQLGETTRQVQESNFT